MFACALAAAQDYRFGSRVHVYRRGEWSTGMVRGEGRGPALSVQIDGDRNAINVLPRDLRPFDARRPEGPAKVGDKVEYFDGRDWSTGVIKEAERAHIVVTPDDGGRERHVTANRYLLAPGDNGAAGDDAPQIPGISQEMLNRLSPEQRAAVMRAQQDMASRGVNTRGRGFPQREAEKPAAYQPGERVEIKTFDGWREAVVVSSGPGGMTFEVRFDGESKEETAFESDIRPHIPGRPKGDPMPGDRVEYEHSRKDWRTGVVKEGDHLLIIKPDYGLTDARVFKDSVRRVPDDYKLDPPPGMEGAVAYDLPPAVPWATSGAERIALFALPDAKAPVRPQPQPIPAQDRINLQGPDASMRHPQRRLRIAAAAPRAAVGYTQMGPGEAPSAVELLDLTGAGSTIGVFAAPLGYAFYDLSPSGERLLLIGGEGDIHSDTANLLVMTVAGDKLEPLAHTQVPRIAGGVAAFITDDIVMTCGQQQINAWSVIEKRGLYRIALRDMHGGSPPQIDAASGLLTLHDEGRAFVLNAADGQVLFEQVLPATSAPSITLSPDGRNLAAVDNASVRIVDTASHDVVVECTFQGMSGDAHWLDDRFLMFGGGRSIFDARQGLIVHGYEVAGLASFACGGGRMWWAFDGSLISEPAPGGDTVTAAHRADPAAAYLLQKGGAVSLQVTGQSSDDVRKAMEQAIAAAGLRLDPSAPVQVVATIKPGEPTTAKYSRGLRKDAQEVTYRPTLHIVQIRTGSETHWTRSHLAGPGMMITIRENQTIQDAINRNTQPTPRWFTTVRLPGGVLSSDYLESLKRTRVTPSGRKFLQSSPN